MRYLTIIFLVSLAVYSCKKRPTKNPTPALEFKSFEAWQFQGRDTAELTIGYEDGDGDIFVDADVSTPNLFITPYSYNEVTNTFVGMFDAQLNDTLMFVYKVRQPDNGYYRGKSITGDIIVPIREFRQKQEQRKLKYTIY